MRVLLVSIPIDFPLAAYCLAARLEKCADLEVELLDLDLSRLNVYNRKNAEIWRFIARLEDTRPDAVGFSVYLWNHLAVRELAAVVRRLHPRLPILLGGPEVADASASRPWLDEGLADVAVHGEGEETLVELAARLAEGRSFEGVAGCSWRRGASGDGGGEVIVEAPRAALRDLSHLPSPYLGGLIDDDAFTRAGVGPGRYARALVETYRGCYMQCSYCQWGNGTMTRFAFPLERVFGELSWLIERRVSEIWIIDAMFGFKKRLAKEILRHIIDEKARTGSESAFVCYHNQDFYDPELFELYREAGVTVEVDLQSTDREVLERVGRGRWYTESFDRHLEAFRRHGVPTSGAADLMIGLPRDRLESFEASVDFLLRRRLRVNLYQTSIIPRTPMLRTADEDGSVFSPVAPRSVLENATFPARDIVTARLIGHGVDFYRLFPQTAHFIERLGIERLGVDCLVFQRPVDLCRRFGESIWRRSELMFGESHTHDAVLLGESELIRAVIVELVDEMDADADAKSEVAELALELFALERAAGEVAPRDVAGKRGDGRAVLEPGGELPSPWLDARLRYRREQVEEVPLAHRIDRVLAWLAEDDAELLSWRELRAERLVALVYRKGPRHSGYRLVDRALSHALLERMNGHFTVAECLLNLLGPSWRVHDLEPLRETLASLLAAGFVTVQESRRLPR